MQVKPNYFFERLDIQDFDVSKITLWQNLEVTIALCNSRGVQNLEVMVSDYNQLHDNKDPGIKGDQYAQSDQSH